MIGKTIARIDTEPIDAEYGGIDRGSLLIHFTDGTALWVEGHSYEAVDLEVEELSAADVQDRAAKVEQRIEEEREEQRKRAEWLALPCVERATQRDAQRANAGPLALLMNDAYAGVYADMLIGVNRQVYGVEAKPVTVRMACPRCGERVCENAPTRVFAPPAPVAEYTGLSAIIPRRTGS